MRRTQALFRPQLNYLPTIVLGQISQLPLNWLLVVCGSTFKTPHIFLSGKQDPAYFLTFPYFLCPPWWLQFLARGHFLYFYFPRSSPETLLFTQSSNSVPPSVSSSGTWVSVRK